MDRPLPRALRWLTVLVLLVLCVTVVFQTIRQVSLRTAIDKAAHDLEITRQRLALQQKEYQQAQAALPALQAQVEETLPLAQAAYEQEQDLRAQRKTLRAENSALAKEIARLEESLAPSEDKPLTGDAIARLLTALESLAALREALQ